MEDFDLPSHGIPPDFLHSVPPGPNGQVGDQLPGDFVAVGRGAALLGMDHCQAQRRIPLLFRFCFPIGGSTRI